MSEATSPVDDATDDLLQAGRDALGRHEWNEAFDRFTEADAAGPLSGEDLERLAQAAFFVARADLEREVKERAFKVYEAEGNRAPGGLHRPRPGPRLRVLGQPRDLDGLGAPCRADPRTGGRHLRRTATWPSSRASERLSRATSMPRSASPSVPSPIGESAADADLKAFGLINMGSLKIANGETTDGIAMMEEASIAAVNGELSPFTTGVAACSMISACRDLTDYRRANEWIEATERYCHRQAL